MDRLSTLKLFVSAVDLGSISGAGRAYGMSTTGASRRIQELEARLGVRLLDRTTRTVTPTEAGRRLHGRISTLLSGIDAALRDASETADQPVGLLRVLARRSFGMLHVTPMLPRFLADYPGITVDLELTERIDIAPGDGVDVAIRLGTPAEKSLLAHPLASGARVLCASPRYLARRGAPATVAALADHACLTYRRAHEPPLWVFEGAAGSEGQRARRQEVAVGGPLRATSGEVLRAAAIAGLGLALLPLWMVADDIAAGRLVRCLDGVRAWPAGFDSEIVAVHRRAEPVPAKIRAFITRLRAHGIEGAPPGTGAADCPAFRE